MPRVSQSPQTQGRNRNSEVLSRVTRLFKILTILTSKRPEERISRIDLAESCECEPRTVQRDIDVLNSGGAWVEYDRTLRSYVLVASGWNYPIAEWTLEDVMALALARGLLSSPDIPAAGPIRHALDKSTASLSLDLRQLVTDAAAVFRGAPGPRDYHEAPLTDLAQAAAAHTTVDIDYKSLSGGERSWRRVDPYAIERRDGNYLDLHAWCHRNQAIRMFALNRIHALRSTDSQFTINETAWAPYAGARGIIGGLRGGSPIRVEVRFAATVARYATERLWSDGLTITLEPDGSALLTGTVQGTAGILPELLRWKRYATVLGGPELREAIVTEIQAMSQAYIS